MTKDEQRGCLKAMLEGYEHLAEERCERVRNASTAESLEGLSSLFDSAVWLHPPKPSSGLVEQQDLFARARR